MSYLNLSRGRCVLVHCMVEVQDVIHAEDLINFDVFYWVCTAFVVLYGTLITIGIFYYERYSGDPQKRSLGNRFVSKGVLSCYVSALSMELFVGSLR